MEDISSNLVALCFIKVRARGACCVWEPHRQKQIERNALIKICQSVCCFMINAKMEIYERAPGLRRFRPARLQRRGFGSAWTSRCSCSLWPAALTLLQNMRPILWSRTNFWLQNAGLYINFHYSDGSLRNRSVSAFLWRKVLISNCPFTSSRYKMDH